MADPRFFKKTERTLTLGALAAHIDASLPEGVNTEQIITDIIALDKAGADEISFFIDKRYANALTQSKAAAILLTPEYADACPPHSVAIACADPYGAMARIAQLFYPEQARALPLPDGLQDGHQIHPSAKLEEDVHVGQGALIGPNAEIGRGTVIGAYTIIGQGVAIGRDCTIAPHVTIGYALIGDRVIIHPSTVIGADGFGFAPGAAHIKIPQLGRVIIQSDVEVGAQCAIDRGAQGDTVIGEGTKIDNLVQIGHNVVIGRHCFIVSQTGLAGSTILEDYVQMGGQSGAAGHLTIGAHSMVAAQAGVIGTLPAGSKVAGMPARPLSEFYRDIAFVQKLRKKPKTQ